MFLSGCLDGKVRMWSITDKKVLMWSEITGDGKSVCYNIAYLTY